MSLSPPALGPLRIASPADILRVGVVAASGFRYSPVFAWERPYHEAYPADTLLSYRQEFSNVVKNPEYIVLVAIDAFDPNEGKRSEAVIPPDDGADIPAQGEEVVVGVACWKLQPGSGRTGHFQNETGEYPPLPPNRHRDQNPDHVKRFSQAAEAAEHKYFHNIGTMEMVVVHPAYWRRGHGERLVKWGMKLANIDQVRQGVIAAKMGEDLYKRLGYTHLEDVALDGDDEAPKGLKCAVMEYDPAKSRSSEL